MENAINQNERKKRAIPAIREARKSGGRPV